MAKRRYIEFASMVGTTVDGRYQLLSLLGEGGQAGVFRGWDHTEGRSVAVKVLKDDDARRSVSRRKRFTREARALQQLGHPNCVRMLDSGEDAELDVRYMVMEMVDGQPLDIFIHFPMTERQVLSLGHGIALGLGEAHKHGIYHRDLKPENIVLKPGVRTTDHRPVLIDFGIAKFSAGYQMTMLTGTEVVLGTVQYMSPEQAEGLPLDARTDIYSLGVVLYELLCGHPPFDGKPIRVLQSHLSDELPALRPKPNMAMARGTWDVIARCLEKARDHRFSDGQATAEGIWACIAELDRDPLTAAATAVVWLDGRGLLAVAYASGEVEFREVSVGRRVARFIAHSAPIIDLASVNRGATTLALAADGVVTAWRPDGTAAHAPFTAFDVDVTCVAGAAERGLYAVGTTDGRIRVFELGETTPLAEFHSHRGAVNQMTIDPTGQLLITAGDDAGVLVWGLKAFEVENRYAVEGNAATSVGFDPRHGVVVMGSDTGRITVGWLDGRHREVVFFAHAAAVSSVHIVDFEGGLDIVSTGCDGEVRQWSAVDGTARPHAGLHPSGIRDAVVLSDGAILALNDCQVLKWHHAFKDPSEGSPDGVLSAADPSAWIVPTSPGPIKDAAR